MSRSKMPFNNRVSGSNALKTNDIWSKTIGHDPYASKIANKEAETQQTNLAMLVKLTNVQGGESRGGCAKCGMLGHLTFQCRNPPQDKPVDNFSDSDSEDDSSDPDVSILDGKRKRNSTADEVEATMKKSKRERKISKKDKKRDKKHKKKSR